VRQILFLPLLALFAACFVAGPAAVPAMAQTSSAPKPAPAFLSVMDDVPLMPGLTEHKDAAVVFDKPEGRIVEAEAAGRLARADVLKFYAASLPQLGWRAQGSGRFLRDREELTLNFSGTAPSLTVRFTLSPDR
jgi:hypothetical protein